jgi:hypothetical protein
MRQLLIFCLLSLFLCVPASSQMFSIPPSPGAILVGTFTVSVSYDPSTGTAYNGSVSSSSTFQMPSTTTIVGQFRTVSGKNEFMIGTDSIRFSGSDEGINQIPTAKIYEYLSLATVGKSIELGYTDCAATTSSSVKVYAEACVSRVGSGIDTRFIPCDRTTFSAREYAVACPVGPGAPQITAIPGAGTPCNSGSSCEPTNPPGGNGTSTMK